MPCQLCTHVREDGRLCQMPALKSRRHCYYHAELRARRLRIARARARSESWMLELPALEDLPAVQAAGERIFEAMGAGLIDPKLAHSMVSLLRVLSTNFRHLGWDQHTSRYEKDGLEQHIVSYPGLERAHGLPDDIDLDANPQELFPVSAAGATAAGNEPATSREPSAENTSAPAPQRSSRNRRSRSAPLPPIKTAVDSAAPPSGHTFKELQAMALQCLNEMAADGTLAPDLLEEFQQVEKKRPASVDAASEPAGGAESA